MNFHLTDTTSWLAYADYLQDNDQPYQHIIDDLDQQINQWQYESRRYDTDGLGVGGVTFNGVGDTFRDGIDVGTKSMTPNSVGNNTFIDNYCVGGII